MGDGLGASMGDGSGASMGGLMRRGRNRIRGWGWDSGELIIASVATAICGAAACQGVERQRRRRNVRRPLAPRPAAHAPDRPAAEEGRVCACWRVRACRQRESGGGRRPALALQQ